jgi:RNA polymerase sigma-70 factor, ECF subfamily
MTASQRSEVGENQSTDFETFFRSEYLRLLQAMYLASGSRADAEDLAQEAMARAFERWDRIGELASPQGYVYTTAFNLHRSRMRRVAMSFKHRSDPPAPHEPSEVASDRAEIHRILQSIPRSQREALLLVEWVGMSSEEAGTVLGIDPSSVRGRVHRAKQTIRRRFGGLDE